MSVPMTSSLATHRLLAAKYVVLFLWGNALVLGAVDRWVDEASMKPALAGLLLALLASVTFGIDRLGMVNRLVSSLCGVSFAALFLACAEGSPVETDMHMYFFAVLAINAIWCCWRSLAVSALFIVGHHLVLNTIYPAAVFPEVSDISRVLLHGAIVCVEVAALIVLVLRIKRAFARADAAAVEASDSRAVALQMAEQQSVIAADERSAKDALIDEVNRFRLDVQHALTAIRQAGSALQGTSGSLLAMAGASAAAAGETRSGSVLSAERLAAVTVTTDGLAQSITEVAARVSVSVSVLKGGSQVIDEASRRAMSLVATMTRTESFVSSIQQIAAQTNMLALNATIEAARAGDSGRGFAVVAGEVKTLAHETSKMACQIEESLRDMRGGVDLSAESVTGIAIIMDDVNDHAVKILNAVVGQTEGTQDIAHAVVDLAKHSQHMAQQSSIASRSAEDTSRAAEMVEASSEEVVSASDSLNARIEAFLDSIAARSSERGRGAARG